MYLIGLAAGLATQSPTPETMVLKMMVSFGLVVPAMAIVLFSTFTTTFLDIDSTAVSALNIHAKLGEKKGIILGGTVGRIIALVFGEYPERSLVYSGGPSDGRFLLGGRSRLVQVGEGLADWWCHSKHDPRWCFLLRFHGVSRKAAFVKALMVGIKESGNHIFWKSETPRGKPRGVSL